MEIRVVRESFNRNETIGRMFINGKFFCYTLEDRDRELHQMMTREAIAQKKVYGQTAIPSGHYPLRLTYSPRFKKILPQLMGVKCFEGIRIHSGNHHLHTEGCIIVGMSRDDHSVLQSGKAMLKLMPILRLLTEPIFIDVG
jgi:hypothetical protein